MKTRFCLFPKMIDKKKVQIYLEEKHLENINKIIEKKSFEGTPIFNSVSHFCRCATIRFIKNNGGF